MSVFFAFHVHDDFLMYICYRHACKNVGSEKTCRTGMYMCSVPVWFALRSSHSC